MANIGKVTVQQQNRSVIVSDKFKAKPNVTLNEVNGVSTAGAENGYTLVYNSTTDTWEPRSIEAATTIAQLSGGTF